MEKQLTEAQLALAFADEHRNVLSWRKRRPLRGEPLCWFYKGRLDEYGIWARKLGRDYLAVETAQSPEYVGTDASDERVYRMLELAKRQLTVK
jgi:hypothetical protein